MSRHHLHPEEPLGGAIFGWLRAAVLGANDGIVSTASLIVGVAAAAARLSDILIAGAAGLVAGAMSMAAGEYVSVSGSLTPSRRTSRASAESWPQRSYTFERRGAGRDLRQTWRRSRSWRSKWRDQLMAKDALGAHARDELRISEVSDSATRAGCTHLGRDIRRRRGDAATHGRRLHLQPSRVLDRLAGLAGIPRRAGSQSEPRQALRISCRATARVTFWGALGDGGDRGHRQDLRDNCLADCIASERAATIDR